MIIEWLGQSSFKIIAQDHVIYIDPYAGDYEDAQKADIILITHDHFDHFSKEIIEKISAESTQIIGPTKVSSEILAKTMNNNDEIEVKGVKIKALPSYNVESQNHPKGEGNGYIFELEGKKIYHAGDTDFIPEMNAIEPDLAMLPVGGTYTMDSKEAISAIDILSPKVVIPMHWGKVVGSREDAEHVNEEVEKASNTKVNILEEGEDLEF